MLDFSFKALIWRLRSISVLSHRGMIDLHWLDQQFKSSKSCWFHHTGNVSLRLTRKLGLFYVIEMHTSTSPFAYCLETSRLDDRPLQITRQCSLSLRVLSDKIHLKSSECTFTDQFKDSTIIIEQFPSIFLEQIENETFAIGRIFQATSLKDFEVKQWNSIRISVCTFPWFDLSKQTFEFDRKSSRCWIDA